MTAPAPLRIARIRLLWHPQAQFAGYLLAEQAGLGANRGVALRTSPMVPGTGPMAALLSGDAEFAVASPSHLLESGRGGDVVMLLAIQQSSALVYPAHRCHGIERLTDLRGRRVAVWPGNEDLELRWMLARAGVPPDEVERVPVPDTVAPFRRGEVDCAQMTVYHELHEIEGDGSGDVVLFSASTFGASLLKDGLFTTRRLADESPDLVQAVVDAVLQGWATAFATPDRAVDACLRARPGLDRDGQARQLAVIRSLAAAGCALVRGLGYPDPEHVVRAARAMADLGHPVDADVARMVRPEFWSGAPRHPAPVE